MDSETSIFGKGYVCVILHGGGIRSGGRAGWLVTARLLVRVSWRPWARHLTLISPDELAVAWLTPAPSVCECGHAWVNVNQHCKALWIKALCKWGPFTILHSAIQWLVLYLWLLSSSPNISKENSSKLEHLLLFNMWVVSIMCYYQHNL